MPRRMLTCCEREERGRSRKVMCACAVQVSSIGRAAVGAPLSIARPARLAPARERVDVARLLRRHRPSPPSPRRGDGGRRRLSTLLQLLPNAAVGVCAELAFADRPAAALGAATGVGRRAGDLRAMILDLRAHLVGHGPLCCCSHLLFAAAAAPTAVSRKRFKCAARRRRAGARRAVCGGRGRRRGRRRGRGRAKII